MGQGVDSELREILMAERDRASDTLSTLGTLRWAVTGGLLAAGLGVLSFVMNLDPKNSLLASLVVEQSQLLGLGYCAAAFASLSMVGFQIYFENSINEQVLRAARAGELLSCLAEHPILPACEDLRFGKQWEADRLAVAILLVAGCTVLVGAPSWGALANLWPEWPLSNGWFAFGLGFAPCLAAAIYLWYAKRRLKHKSDATLLRLRAELQQRQQQPVQSLQDGDENPEM